MRHATSLWEFSTTRMLQQYTELLYLPAAGIEIVAPPGAGRHRGLAVPRRIALALVLHSHQPVGNFGWVIAEVFEKATRR